MFERYTERARRCLFFARHEADQLGAVAIAPEHLFLGLLKDGKGLVSRLFASRQLSLDDLRERVTCRVERGSARGLRSVEVPFTASSKQALQAAAATADRLGHRDIGVEHLLIALIELNDPIAAATLREVGVTTDAVEQAMRAELPSIEVTVDVQGGASVEDSVRQLRQEIRELRARVERLEQQARPDPPS